MAYKMKGFGGFGNSPAKQTKFPNSEASKSVKGKRLINKQMKLESEKPPRDPEKPITQEELRIGGVRTKKSPASQTKFPNSPKSQIKLQKGEMEGTSVTGGSESERIADLEDRLEFLNSDIEGGSDRPGQSMSDMKKARAKLQARLTNIRKADKK